MVYVQYRGNYSPSRFFLNRVLRIVPLYWILTSVLIVLRILYPSEFTLKLTLDWALNSICFTSGFLHKTLPILQPGWTLEFEMVFYVLFSISLFFKTFKYSTIFTLISILLFVSTTHYTIMMEFVFSMVIGILFISKKINYRLAMIIFWIGIVMMICSAYVQDPNINRAILPGIPAMFIVFSLLNLPQYKNTLLITLGDASYSIYLVQIFTIPLFYKVLAFLHANHHFNNLYFIVCLGVTVFVGYLVHIFLELKLTSLPMFKHKNIIMRFVKN